MKQILYTPDPAAGGDTTIADDNAAIAGESNALKTANEEIIVLKRQLEEAAQKKSHDEGFEAQVAVKMRLGLKRDQATAAVRRQEAFDASDYGKAIAQRHADRQAAAGARRNHPGNFP
jgi:hypothetical protein